MKRGNITINENDTSEWIVQATLIDRTLWLTKHEIADLFGVFVNTVGNNLRAIFKSGMLHEDEVTRIYEYEYKGRQRIMVLYNLEALIFVSYRISSFQAKAFREWVMNALYEYNRTDKRTSAEVVVVYNLNSRMPDITLN